MSILSVHNRKFGVLIASAILAFSFSQAAVANTINATVTGLTYGSSTASV